MKPTDRSGPAARTERPVLPPPAVPPPRLTVGRVLGPIGWTLLCAIPVVLWIWYQWDLEENARWRFERPWALLLLAAGPAVLATMGWLEHLRTPRLLVSRGMDLAVVRPGRALLLRGLSVGMRTVAVLLLALCLARPQTVSQREETDVEGIDIVLVLDLSLSMQAADITPNRFEAMKVVVDDFIRRRLNDRIGAVVFGRDAFTLCPPTTDYTVLRSMISELSLGIVDGRGTAIGNGISTGLNRIRRSRAKSKVIVLITDGDSNAGNVSPQQAADFAKAMRVKIYSVLMGATGDPRSQSGTDFFGRPIFDRGRFPVNPELLREVSRKTGGEFYQVTDRRGFEESMHRILDTLERARLTDIGVTFGELFPLFLWPALLYLAIDLLVRGLLIRRFP